MADVADLNPEFYGNLQRFMAAAPGPLSIVSAYRSPEHQAELWNAALQKYGSPEAARKWVAPPGHSQHNIGMAVDLGFGGAGLGSGDQSLIDWAHQNAGEYGLTFPLANEAWHIEPMGARASNATTNPVPTSGHAALFAPPGDNAAASSGGAPSLLAPPLSMLPPILTQGTQSGDGFAPVQMLAEKFKPMQDAMQSFQQGYSSDRFLSDMFAGQNPMRRMVFGALGNLYRSSFGASA